LPSGKFTPRASIAQIYSDNIDQAPRGEENSEPVTDLNVGFRLNRDGPRGSGRFDYNLQASCILGRERLKRCISTV
jgi:hypothetical protein